MFDAEQRQFLQYIVGLHDDFVNAMVAVRTGKKHLSVWTGSADKTIGVWPSQFKNKVAAAPSGVTVPGTVGESIILTVVVDSIESSMKMKFQRNMSIAVAKAQIQAQVKFVRLICRQAVNSHCRIAVGVCTCLVAEEEFGWRWLEF